MSDKELSNLSMDRKECPKCGAVWLNGQHIWTGTGQRGDEEALHNLVCSKANDPDCVNPKYKKGSMYDNADSWEKRAEFINGWSPDA